ncbi:hypothetical protein [Caulifigura coniformis]|nr:hypothetical protein [Caulifigura coniformis]
MDCLRARGSKRWGSLLPMVAMAIVLAGSTSPVIAADLHVGKARRNITPDGPIPLSGQMHTRISKAVESPVYAEAIALESRDGQTSVDQAIMIACDLVAIREGIIDDVRSKLKDRLPGFDVSKLVISATHTHTAPEVRDEAYDLPPDGIVRPSQYRVSLVDRLAEVAAEAWDGRKPGFVGWGLGHAVVAHNRRALYKFGEAKMYGATNTPNFRGIEGYEDHGVEVLCFWNSDRQLIATAINVACPAQEVESRSAVNADFWHQVRTALRKEHGDDLCILGWIGAAGDQSPHLMFRKAAEERMRKLRGLDPLEEIARRVVDAWQEAYDGAKQEMHGDAPLMHRVSMIDLPVRQVTEAERAAAQKEVEALSKDPKNLTRMRWNKAVLDRYESQTPETTYPMELHVLRLGDVAIATNSFELFTDYGIQMKSRSPALQTFVIQLAGPGSYLPSQRAVLGGSYSAVIQSNKVGPEGGQTLVDETVSGIEKLWEKK